MTKKSDARLAIHHIGGRAGGRTFPQFPRFERDVVNVLYDADPDCINQVRERNAGFASQLHVVPLCVADKRRKVVFDVNYDPYTSSLYQLKPDYATAHTFVDAQDAHDYIYGETIVPVKKIEMEAAGLDDIYGPEDRPCPAPDFLSIDAEGADYDVLVGAKETLRDSILVVNAETQFAEVHTGQKLFGDVLDLLIKSGFHFVNFPFQLPLAMYRYPVGLRADGFVLVGEALFFRRIDHLIKETADPAERRVKLRKLAFFAIIYDQLEYALECLKHSAGLPVRPGDAPAYETFLTEVERVAAAAPKIFPETFATRYTATSSQARFESAAEVAAKPAAPTAAKRLKTFVRSIPLFGPLAVKTRLALIGQHRNAWTLLERLKGDSELERLFTDWGLAEQAAVVREKRLAQSWHVRHRA